MKKLWVVVDRVNKYKTLEEYLDKEGYDKALPWTKSKEEALKDYNTWSTAEKRDQLRKKFDYAFVGIGITPVKKINANIKEEYFDQIKSKEKTVEGRLSKGKWDTLCENDIIDFHHNGSKSGILCKVVKKTCHGSIENMIKSSGLGNIFPNTPTIKEGIKVYMDLYKIKKDKGLLWTAIHIALLSK